MRYAYRTKRGDECTRRNAPLPPIPQRSVRREWGEKDSRHGKFTKQKVYWADQWLWTCVINLCTFICRPLQNSNVKWRNSALSGERELRRIINFSYFYLELNAFVAYSIGTSFNTDRYTTSFQINVEVELNTLLRQVQTPYLTWAESNANEKNPLFYLISIRFGSCEVRRLNLALASSTRSPS